MWGLERVGIFYLFALWGFVVFYLRVLVFCFVCVVCLSVGKELVFKRKQKVR